MNEEEWLTFTDPMPMLDFLRSKAGDRKLRLLGVGCCWLFIEQFPDKRLLKGIEIAERHEQATSRTELDDNAQSLWEMIDGRGKPQCYAAQIILAAEMYPGSMIYPNPTDSSAKMAFEIHGGYEPTFQTNCHFSQIIHGRRICCGRFSVTPSAM